MNTSDIDDEEDIYHEMTEIFMPREYWILDSEAKACFLCKTPFDFLTRKHHCRMCGDVFDSK